ncbi:phosphate ABC transporter, ATPase subunit [Melioribacter roseus P3M-2]|uniref:Phosphate ABC transporter, ATPase subunit n=1 Tax=Melioribacter roseus (strain DSM 23840 / JCM 17771 / VKM B-2668 / P3M-2) TaxID=1191523 RepID=I6YZ66_MELRP|nr:phosphate ABC transporter, ATPase subunit [Melioribacter roseus P3M-2]
MSQIPVTNIIYESRKVTEEEAVVSTKNLSAYFGEKQALFEVNLNIPKNQVTAIIGPSGCGKSTFLRCLNRMHEVIGGTYSGSILFDGEDIKNINPVELRKRVGMVFQKPNPFPTMSIMNNVVAGLKLNGMRDKRLLNEIAEENLKKVGLWDEVKDNLNRSGASISGGQQQRLCIARTIALNPEVILMDEPTSALDPIATAKIEDLIYELKKEYTIVIVTHNMQQAARVSDYTAFFYMGRLIEYDNTKKIFTNPSNKQTEEYISGRFG